MHDEEPIAPEMPLAFDEAGRPVPVQEPEVYDQDPDGAAEVFDLAKLLDVLLIAAPGAEWVGERAVFLAFLMQTPRAPKTLRQLGAMLGCSHVTAAARLTKFKADFIEEMRPLLTKPPHR